MRVLALDQCAYSDNYLIDVTREWKLERNRLSMSIQKNGHGIRSGAPRGTRRFGRHCHAGRRFTEMGAGLRGLAVPSSTTLAGSRFFNPTTG
jgi:hypothetical protein